MMTEWVRLILDLVLIALVSAGLIQATRLIRHLAGLRASRLEMERFVHEFGSIVTRAETGIRNLKQAARESGDDLEKLVEKSVITRDELQFLVESADQLAERLSHAASGVARPEMVRSEPARAETKPAETKPAEAPQAKPASDNQKSTPVTPFAARKEPSSRAEKELMQALKKLS